ncbi:hypothetical protein RclHR1_21980006 [Rhizophagus clarus]|uniref:Uncharacterized protein n=1 Tax=Rhizophagus clarus TaxID=94130 RepID=A0A2Z6QYA6_9GLOM|nr:hypothetical protein RclHR1_21980006 [Rhizophagus clarus]
MSEQEYEISSPPPSLFFVNLSDEYNGETSSNEEFEQEEFSLGDNNSISDIDSEDFEENEKRDYETFEKEEIYRTFGKYRTYSMYHYTIYFGTWQVDRNAIKEVDGILPRLGVCDSHFQFDNKYLHKSQNKKLKDFNQGIIQWRRCIFCDKYVTYFSRGVGCNIHSWNLNGQNIQVACNGQFACEALKTCPSLCVRAFDITKPRCICCSCYEDLGGHIHHRPGRGKKATTCITENSHEKDITKGLEFLGDWLINIAQTGHDEIKKDLLIEAFKTFLPFVNKLSTMPSETDSQTTNTSTNQEIYLNEAPSLFMIKTVFIETSKKNKKKRNEKILEISDFKEFGREFGQKLWNSRSDINSKKSALESPKTIQEYCDGFPEFLNNFFTGIIDELYQKKNAICNWQRKRRNNLPKTTSSEQIMKIVTFITSILLGIAFPHLKIWIPRVLASLGRMPRLLGSFRRLLTVCHVTSHSDRHERKLAKVRMEKSNPASRLIQGNNVWNLATIDNIDFKEKSFKFGNIYDVTRDNSHATLRMVFQAQLPIEIETGPEEVIKLTAETSLFGMNQELVYKTNFDAETIKNIILTRLDRGCCGPSPNIVILEPGASPNSDEEILRVAEMYKDDFALESHSFLDIVADEAIFRRLIKCRAKWPNIRPLLGQWHTSKDFCSVLLVLFSSYGLLSLASRLGVRFLDKFESVVDYRSTARVWYLYYEWAGIWKAHRMGMRVGNFDLQQNSLSAAGPLYASAAKSNYTTAIAHYLSIIAAHPKLEEKLRYCGAFKIPHDIDEDPNNVRHVCFGFDEALETFGVRFIKQNVSGNIFNEKNLRDQIKASQDERERIDLLMSEYLDDYSVSHSERAVKSRKESLWELVDDLVTVFGMADPLSHQLFQEYKPTEMHQEGLNRLIACYPDGLERIKAVYRQEVLEIERRNPQGRRTIGVVRTKPKDYNKKSVGKRTRVVAENSNEISPTTEPQPKRRKTTGTKRRTTEDETAILCALKMYKDNLPDDAITSVRKNLSEVWTVKKVREWWNYHKNR